MQSLMTYNMSKVEILRELLHKGAVEFTFKKKDGTIRPATGTTNPSLYTYERKGGSSPAPDMIVYWDMEKNGWRSFHESQLVDINLA